MNVVKDDLRIVRSLALQIPEVALFVSSSRKMTNSRELWISTLCLFVNIIGQMIWGGDFTFPAILFMLVGLVGIAGMSFIVNITLENPPFYLTNQ